MQALRTLASQLADGSCSALQLTQAARELAIADPSVVIAMDDACLTQARGIDEQRQAGKSLMPLAGIPITSKDLFGIAGQQTLAGAKFIQQIQAPETADSAVMARLREAGLLFVGRTNMSPFAFSGLGLNRDFGTPLSVWQRSQQHIAGGSSSGSAVSVANGTVVASMGSDTAGSCRIPAAFNNVVGVKPSFGRYPSHGIFPLSPSSDVPGPIARDVDSCYVLDGVLRAERCTELAPALVPELVPTLVSGNAPMQGLRLGIPSGIVMADLDATVAASFADAIERLRQHGVEIVEVAVPSLERAIEQFCKRPIVTYEAYLIHRHWLTHYREAYEPLVAHRIGLGAGVSAQEQYQRYVEKQSHRAAFFQQFTKAKCAALVFPTVACLPPTLSMLQNEQTLPEINMRCLRNTSSINYVDGCAITLPCQAAPAAPVGMMLSAPHGNDLHLYQVAAAVEQALGVVFQRS